MTAPEVIFLDAGGTLLAPHPSVGAIYSDVARRFGIDAPAVDVDAGFRRAWKAKKMERASIEKAWWRTLVAEVFAPYFKKEPAGFFDELYDAFREPSVWKIFPDAIEALAELKKRGTRLAVASNWDDRLPDLLDALDLSRFFERQFVSFAVGFVKPDPRFFLHAAEAMRVAPAAALHVGDDLEEDVAAAEGAGMRALLLDRASKPVPGRINSLTSLVTLVSR